MRFSVKLSIKKGREGWEKCFKVSVKIVVFLGLFRRKMSGQPSLPLSSLSLRWWFFDFSRSPLARRPAPRREYEATKISHKSCAMRTRWWENRLWSERVRFWLELSRGHRIQNWTLPPKSLFFSLSLNVYAPSIQFVSRNRAREDATRTREFAKRARRDRTRTLFRRRVQQ